MSKDVLRVWRLFTENRVHVNPKQGPEQLRMFHKKIGEPSESLMSKSQKRKFQKNSKKNSKKKKKKSIYSINTSRKKMEKKKINLQSKKNAPSTVFRKFSLFLKSK